MQSPRRLAGSVHRGVIIAKGVHEFSRSRRFFDVNCSTLSPSLAASTLFGHKRGAFTGADSDKDGSFALAEGGVLFLDEIGTLPLEVQPLLLRVLEAKTYRPVGGSENKKVNCRIVAATNEDLAEAVRSGRFRGDLYDRLAVFTVRIPPLRERPEDILFLAEHLIETVSSQPKPLSLYAKDALEAYSWPGNVRELRNAVVRACAFSDREIWAKDLELPDDGQELLSSPVLTGEQEEEKAKILEAIEQNGGNRSKAANAVGMAPSTFAYRCDRLGIGKKHKKR